MTYSRDKRKIMKINSEWAYRDGDSPTAERFVVLQTLLAIPSRTQPCEIFRNFPRRNILKRRKRKCIRESKLLMMVPRQKKGKIFYSKTFWYLRNSNLSSVNIIVLVRISIPSIRRWITKIATCKFSIHNKKITKKDFNWNHNIMEKLCTKAKAAQ